MGDELMKRTKTLAAGPEFQPKRSWPPGRVKIVNALRGLLAAKDFASITTAEIAKNAGVTEALIYKYFKDKRDLLYQVLAEYLLHYKKQAEADLAGIDGGLDRLKKIIWTHISFYATDRVFAKMLLLEVRSYSDYYVSEPYALVREYSDVVLGVVKHCMAEGVFRDDLAPELIRQVILGSIEHVCLTGVALDREIDPDPLTEDLYACLMHGLAKPGR
jgi:AcrR family transcriptional regulator